MSERRNLRKAVMYLDSRWLRFPAKWYSSYKRRRECLSLPIFTVCRNRNQNNKQENSDYFIDTDIRISSWRCVQVITDHRERERGKEKRMIMFAVSRDAIEHSNRLGRRVMERIPNQRSYKTMFFLVSGDICLVESTLCQWNRTITQLYVHRVTKFSHFSQLPTKYFSRAWDARIKRTRAAKTIANGMKCTRLGEMYDIDEMKWVRNEPATSWHAIASPGSRGETIVFAVFRFHSFMGHKMWIPFAPIEALSPSFFLRHFESSKQQPLTLVRPVLYAFLYFPVDSCSLPCTENTKQQHINSSVHCAFLSCWITSIRSTLANRLFY